MFEFFSSALWFAGATLAFGSIWTPAFIKGFGSSDEGTPSKSEIYMVRGLWVAYAISLVAAINFARQIAKWNHDGTWAAIKDAKFGSVIGLAIDDYSLFMSVFFDQVTMPFQWLYAASSHFVTWPMPTGVAVAIVAIFLLSIWLFWVGTNHSENIGIIYILVGSPAVFAALGAFFALLIIGVVSFVVSGAAMIIFVVVPAIAWLGLMLLYAIVILGAAGMYALLTGRYRRF